MSAISIYTRDENLYLSLSGPGEGYDLATGKIRYRHYYRADETQERAEEYDLATEKMEVRRYYRADETLERRETYDKQGKLIPTE